jgi:hypothetical protein
MIRRQWFYSDGTPAGPRHQDTPDREDPSWRVAAAWVGDVTVYTQEELVAIEKALQCPLSEDGKPDPKKWARADIPQQLQEWAYEFREGQASQAEQPRFAQDRELYEDLLSRLRKLDEFFDGDGIKEKRQRVERWREAVPSELHRALALFDQMMQGLRYQCEVESQDLPHKRGRTADEALNAFIRQLARLYEYKTGNKPTAAYDITKDTCSPFVQFVDACVRPIDPKRCIKIEDACVHPTDEESRSKSKLCKTIQRALAKP